MSGIRSKRESNEGMDRNRHHERRRSFSRDRHSRRRCLDSRSRSRSRENYEDMDRNRHRERRRSRSYSRDRHSRRRCLNSRSRSRSRGRSSSRHHQSYSRDNRSSRYNSRRFSVSRSRSRSRTRRNSRSHSRSYSRTQRHSRTPSKSLKSPPIRQSLSSDREENISRRQNNIKKEIKQEQLPLQVIEEEVKISNDSSSVDSLPLPPKKEPIGAYYNLDTEEPIDKEKIHREMEEKLRAALAKDGKVYPPPKVEASHPVFANDGSFIEIFKKMQQAMPSGSTTNIAPLSADAASTSAAASTSTKTAPPPPMVGRRRGGKILKTGLVAKPKVQGEDNGDPKDFWSLYLREVNKYKNNACDSDGGTRPLVK